MNTIEKEKKDDHYDKYTNNLKERIKNKKSANITEELKEFLVNIKDAKLKENQVLEIIEKLNLKYFVSLWLDHKKIFKLIYENNGNYEQISNEIENLL